MSVINYSRYISVLTTFIVISLSFNSYAQVRRFEAIDNYPNNVAIDIIKDPYGFIWIGHDGGVTRYDGNEFLEFDIKDENPNHIDLEAVWRLWIDSHQQLWIGGGNNGCAQYDYATETFKHYHFANNDSTQKLFEIRDFYEDLDSTLWIGTGDGLFYYDRDRQVILKAAYDQEEFEKFGEIHAILSDKQGKLWLGTGNGNLYWYYPKTNKLERYQKGFFQKESRTPSFIVDIHQDKKGQIWVLGQSIAVVINPETDEQVSYKEQLMDTQIAKCISEDYEGNIWIASSGLNIISPDLKQVDYCLPDNSGMSIRSLSTNKVYFDNQGITWIASWFGGLDINIQRKNHVKLYQKIPGEENSLSHSVIHCLYEDENNNMWIGTDDGILNKLDVTNNRFYHFTDPGMNIIEPVSCISNGTSSSEMLLGTWGSLKSFDIKTEEFKRLKEGIQIPDLLKYNDSTVYVGVINKGLYQFSLTDRSFFNVYRNFRDGCKTEIYFTRDLYPDNRDNLWIINWAGLVKYDIKDSCYYSFSRDSNNPYALPPGQIHSCLLDSKNRMWIGNVKGISIYNYDENYFMTFGHEHGMEGTKVRSMLEDDEGNIWVATEKGISKFCLPAVVNQIERDSLFIKQLPKDFVYFRNYNEEDGFIKGEFSNDAYKSKDGTMYFGGMGGINSFKPESIEKDTIEAPIHFIELKVFNEIVRPNKESFSLSKSLVVADKIILTFEQYFFSIKWVALNFYSTKKIEYAYKLDGFDKDWNYIGKERTATFTGLPAGEYELKVKCTNSDGIWLSNEASIKIIILPPWWATWWFRVASAGVLFSLFLYFMDRRINNLKRQKQILQRNVSERTKELKDANATKDKFFSIIAHDLRNPFQTMLGYSDLLLDYYRNSKESQPIELSKRINQVASRTLNLLENLLMWASAQQGKISHNPTRVSVEKFILENLEVVKGIADKKNIKLTYHLSPNMYIWADQDTINVILRNILSNAIKFSFRNGNIHLTVTKTTKDEKSFALFSVKDTGIGMTQETIDSLFVPTSLKSKEGTEKESGTGLGLMLCKDFVESNNGQIWVKAELVKGSTFYFTLPIDNNQV